MTLPDDLIKIRDELAEEHKLLTKDNGIESSNYHFKVGFNACAEIFLKQCPACSEVNNRQSDWCYGCQEQANQKLQANNESLRQYGLEQFRLAQKLQARIDKLVEALEWIQNRCETEYSKVNTSVGVKAKEALAADKEQG